MFPTSVTTALFSCPPKSSGSTEGTSTNTNISARPTRRGTERNGCPRARLRPPMMPSEIAIPPARNPTLVQNPKSKFSAFKISSTKTTVRSGSAFANACRAEYPRMKVGSPALRNDRSSSVTRRSSPISAYRTTGFAGSERGD